MCFLIYLCMNQCVHFVCIGDIRVCYTVIHTYTHICAHMCLLVCAHTYMTDTRAVCLCTRMQITCLILHQYTYACKAMCRQIHALCKSPSNTPHTIIQHIQKNRCMQGYMETENGCVPTGQKPVRDKHKDTKARDVSEETQVSTSMNFK